MRRSKKKMVQRNNENVASFKESAMIGQFTAKLRRKEITRADVPQPIMDMIDANMMRSIKKTMEQAGQFADGVEPHEHIHGEGCNHSDPLTSQEEVLLDNAGLTTVGGEPIVQHVCNEDCDHGAAI
jgi:hypothetical protein